MIQVQDIEFAYRSGGFRLRIASLRISAGEKVAITGPSGSGKTTLLNLLAGVLVPEAGTIVIDGVGVSQLPHEDRQDFRILRMGLVFQEFELLEYLTVLDNVLLPYRVSPVLILDEIVRERAEDSVREVGLGRKVKRFPGQLSQGEKQRVAVCRALVTQPSLVLCDEPTGNLDTSNRDHILQLLLEYSDSSGAPLVVITHDTELLHCFDRVLDSASWESETES